MRPWRRRKTLCTGREAALLRLFLAPAFEHLASMKAKNAVTELLLADWSARSFHVRRQAGGDLPPRRQGVGDTRKPFAATAMGARRGPVPAWHPSDVPLGLVAAIAVALALWGVFGTCVWLPLGNAVARIESSGESAGASFACPSPPPALAAKAGVREVERCR
jgi:hypothetical protein